MIDESSKFSNYENINQINLLKFINIINDRIISQDKKHLSDRFGQLCPFLNIDLFYYLDSLNTTSDSIIPQLELSIKRFSFGL